MVGCSLRPSGADLQPPGEGGAVVVNVADPPRDQFEWSCGNARTGDVETSEGTPLGLTAHSLNGCIQPRGEPATYYFEYGRTTAYDARTPATELSPKLAAFYRESWDQGLDGWAGGMLGDALSSFDTGGQSAGFVRARLPSGIDPNHADGIGFLQLAQYSYIGTYIDEAITTSLGGGDPDFRDARISVEVRGKDFVPNGTELVFWAQADSDLAQQNDQNWRRANWAHTGFNLTDAAFGGAWQHLDYRLENDSRAWTYSGQNADQKRPNYVYAPIGDVLGHLNCDIFHLLTFVSLDPQPRGNIDFDELQIAYRNHSLLFPANGAKLVSSPPSAIDPARLTDGWRNGVDRTWRSGSNASGPLEFEYELANPVSIEVVQIHQDPDFPSRDIEVLVSDGTTWTTIASGTVPVSVLGKDKKPLGPNFQHFLARGLTVPPTRRVKVRVLSGYKEQWGLGEIELFGRGAEKATDDDWYHVSLDVGGLVPGDTYHYRLVAKTKTKTLYGADRTFTVSTQRSPLVWTGVASRIGAGTAKLEARVNALGQYSEYYFQYGADTAYGDVTPRQYAGLDITPRTSTATLTNLTPGQKYYYRVVAANDSGASFGADAWFVAK